MKPELRRVRPSSLGMAKHCARAPWLSAKYNESHVATRLGSAVDGQVTALIRCDDIEEDIFPETELVIAWLGENFPSTEWEYHAQTPVELLDPETGEVLTKGTPDLLCVHRTEPRISVIDYKKRGQFFSGHLPPPEENLQQLAYLAAAWLKLSKERTIRQGDIPCAAGMTEASLRRRVTPSTKRGSGVSSTRSAPSRPWMSQSNRRLASVSIAITAGGECIAMRTSSRWR